MVIWSATTAEVTTNSSPANLQMIFLIPVNVGVIWSIKRIYKK